MNNKLYELLKLIFCLLFFFFCSDIIISLLKIFGINLLNVNNMITVIYQFILTLIMSIIFFIIHRKNIIEDFIKFTKTILKNIIYIIKMFFVFMIVKYIVSFISVFIMILLGFDTSSMTSVNQNLIENYLKTFPILMFITTTLLAPFYEEVLFRLGFKKVIKNKYSFIIISGALFGLMHVFPLDKGVSLLLGITQSISYVTMGMFLSYIYYKNDNIFMSIGIHFLNNLLSVLVMFTI